MRNRGGVLNNFLEAFREHLARAPAAFQLSFRSLLLRFALFWNTVGFILLTFAFMRRPLGLSFGCLLVCRGKPPKMASKRDHPTEILGASFGAKSRLNIIHKSINKLC